jgi:HSP20 family protein
MYTLSSPRTFLDEFFRDFERTPSPAAATFRPAVDVAQVDDGYVLRAELAGVSKESVHVEVKDQVLSISGERVAPEVASKGYRHSEIGYGKFERRFHLAESIDLDKVEAKFENGFLEVKLALKPELGPRQVAVL